MDIYLTKKVIDFHPGPMRERSLHRTSMLASLVIQQRGVFCNPREYCGRMPQYDSVREEAVASVLVPQ